MAKQSGGDTGAPTPGDATNLTSSVDEMLLAAMERGDDSLQTGRQIITFKEGAAEQGLDSLRSSGLRVADARDFTDQAVAMQDVGDADTLILPEIGVAVVSGTGFQSAGLGAMAFEDSDSAIATIEPEYFAFADDLAFDYLRGFKSAADAILADIGTVNGNAPTEGSVEAEVLGATWGINACRVPLSPRSGAGIRVAVLDTGMDIGHPDFIGRSIVTNTFVGQPVQDLHGHGTHCIGTACGPKAPSGTTPRYGCAFQSTIFVGKVLSNSGSGSSASVLAGMNWAIANRCSVISMSLGSSSPVQAAYTAAGQAALNNGCLIIAAAGNVGGAPTGAPANSPTIVAVASLDSNLSPSSYSSQGKIEIAGPGRDVFSSWPRPTRYRTISGTSMATPHVAGCAALLAQTNPAMRGLVLRNRLLALARPLPFPSIRVGRGLVQAPLF